MVEHLSVFDYNNFPNSCNSLVLATYLVNVIRDLKQRERWRHGHQNGNRKLILSLFHCSNSTNSYSGSQNTAWDISFPFISETSNFRLLFMTSRTSALSLLQLATFDCEQSPFSQSSQGSARLDWRERNCQEENWRDRERPHPSFSSADLVFFFFSFASLDFLARTTTLRDCSQSNVIKAF